GFADHPASRAGGDCCRQGRKKQGRTRSARVKPVDFDYARPRRLADAVALLAESGDRGKVLAGGQSLGPMLNMRLVQPELVVDITALDELKRAEKIGDHLVLGACVTHADIEDGRVSDVTNGAMRSVAAGIAYRAVRNRGT